jgi:hypothetical protein
VVGQYINGWIAGEAGGEMGGLRGLDVKYGVNKPIELNGTDYYPLNYRGDKIADSRVEAWEFIVGGGAGFNQLNGLFTVADPSGKHPDNEKLFAALRHLSEFMTSFEFTKMHPDSTFVSSGLAKGAYYRTLSEPGRQYAFYLHHSGEKKTGSYEVVPGSYSESLELNLPTGSYRADWIDPASGNVLASQNIDQQGGKYTLSAPHYTIDIALRIKRN